MPAVPLLQAQSSAPVHFEYFTTKDGLSQSSVNCIMQDSAGFLWFGTQHGLNRYDGYGFKVIKSIPSGANSLSHIWVQAIMETEPGILWIGTMGEGLHRFDTNNHHVTRYKYEPGNKSELSENTIQALFKDSAGILWIGTEGSGLDSLDPVSGRWVNYAHSADNQHSLSHNSVNAIYEDDSGTLWVGTGNGLNRFDRQTGRFTHFFNDIGNRDSLSGNTVTDICKGPKGNLWIGTLHNGLNRYLGKNRFEHFRNDPGNPASLCSNTINCLLVDRDGHLWVGTGIDEIHGHGVSRLNFNENTGQWELTNYAYLSSPGEKTSAPSLLLSDRTILSLYEDNGGNIWFGTFLGGINKYSKGKIKFRHIYHDPTNADSLPSNSVLSMWENKSGTIWIGTYSTGLCRYDPDTGRFTDYNNNPAVPTTIKEGSIWNIYSDDTGLLWLATGEKGLYRFNPGTFASKQFSNKPDDPFSLSSNATYCIKKGSSGHLWIGTWGGGLNLLDRETERFYHYPFNLSNPDQGDDIIVSLYEDLNRDLWLCTYGKGLVKVKKSAGTEGRPFDIQFEFFRHNEEDDTSISSDYLMSMVETDSGEIWIGTSYGLNRFDRKTGTFTFFSEADGLSNNQVYGIIPDGEDLWLSTNGGISRFNTQTLLFKTYDGSDGVQGMEFNQGAYLKSSRGEIFLGGTNGINAFFPDQMPINTHVPPIVITQFAIFDTPVTLPRAVYATDRIRLSYKDRFFSFDFTALDFENPGKNRYAYKLEGFNDDWIYCGSRRYASFTNLSGGEFVFKVKGSNNDGTWNNEGTAIHIEITPPPWETWWFRGLVVLVIIGGLVLLFQDRTRHVKQKMEKVHLQNELRLKTDFTAMLVHDLRNPLQCIIGYTDLLKGEINSDGALRFTDRIKLSSKTMLQLINDMLDISKFEAGKMRIRPEPILLVDIVNENIRLMEPLLERKSNRFELDIEPLPAIDVDVVRITQVINNLLANAVKFSPEGGIIRVTAKIVRHEDQVFQEIAVIDQGPGVPAETQAYLFLKYAQIEHKKASPAKGTGLGLAVSRLIIEAHKGTIGYRPHKSGGSIFFFRIPEKQNDKQND
jgi:signal transduction histidine kinase/ligand-binding sensor domain-containing protein